MDIETKFKLIELENSRQAYSPNLILPSGNQMTEKRNGSLIKQQFFNYDVEYTDIPNFFLMQTFNITQLTSNELDALSIDLPSIDRITVKNVTEMLKPIDKSYPFVFPIYGHVLITIGGTIMVIMVIGILYYAKYHRGKVMRPKSRKSNKFPPSTEAIELQPIPHKARKSVKIKIVSGKVTPKTLQRKLKDLGVDFTPYEKYKQKKLQKGLEESNCIV